MTGKRKLAAGLLLAGTSLVAVAGTELSERDYYEELPTVLTVTRLAQPIGDTPGAVTIIDRETIRRSGAREVTDVLRLVPGYLIGGINGSHQSAAYHAPLDDYGARNLVFIDGRSAYNSFYLGATFRGLMGVLVEDIDRIEVLRGSNSAAYGANAMFGVINIVTRHAADTRGGEVSVTQGTRGVQDGMARVGWGNTDASFRLSAGRRQDSGLKGAHDDQRIDQVHFRADLRPAADQELMVTAGSLDMSLQDGEWNKARTAPADGNPFRTTTWRENFINLSWRKQLSTTDELKLSASYDEATSHDNAPYAPDPSVTLDFGGDSRKMNFELQHQVGLTSQLRAVWGVGYERNEAKSAALFARNDWIDVHEERLFGSLEWKPHEQWNINAGGYWNRHSWTGNDFSPRLMANFHATPDHTFRLGASRSVRTPNIFELAADVRYYPTDVAGLIAAGKNAPALAAFWGIPYRLAFADGQARPEKLQTSELGYFGNFRDWRLTLDVRAFVDQMQDLIKDSQATIPGYVTLPNPFGVPVGTAIPVGGYANSPGFKIRGLEYQLRWKPLPGTEIWLNQTFQKLVWDNDASADDTNKPPTRATTIAWFQKLPHDLDFSLIFHSLGSMTWGNGGEGQLPNRRRVDARLALPFRIGSTKAEAAMTVQALDGSYPEYLLLKGYTFERRAFGTLRIEF